MHYQNEIFSQQLTIMYYSYMLTIGDTVLLDFGTDF